RKATELVREIAAACQEQSQGISQISLAVQQMDGIVQSNAMTAQQSADASEKLSAQISPLSTSVNRLESMVVGGARQSDVNAANPGIPGEPAIQPAPIA